MARIRRYSVGVTALAAVAVLLTSCGRSDPGSASATSASGTSGSGSPARTFAAGAAGVVQAADALVATLNADQKEALLLDFTVENANAWDPLPCGSCRVGIPFSELTDEQLSTAKAVLRAALGSGTGAGYDQVMQILLADDLLGAEVGGDSSGYSSDNYYLAFLGTPATTGTWQVHFSGHHLAVNITYVDGAAAGTTPFFIGVEPTSWTADDGTTYAPLNGMRDGMLALIGSLTEDQLAQAMLSESYTEVLMGPDQEGRFPQTKEGLAVGALSDEQQALVVAAIRPWVSVVDDATAEALLSSYRSELDETYISYRGTAALTRHGDYMRIDGPSVWIEFVCQIGAFYPETHYHTVYRDHVRDHGGALP
jgi:Protein of unknown function (DUF3500)